MHIIHALDLMAQTYGEYAPLPRSMQYAAVIHALNKNYGVSTQFAAREQVFLDSLVNQETQDGQVTEKTLADLKQRFQDIVTWVMGFMDDTGRVVMSGNHYDVTDNSTRIADYLSSLEGAYYLSVMPSHVRAARQQVTGKSRKVS